jgi:hypothetical protein
VRDALEHAVQLLLRITVRGGLCIG